MSFGPNPWQQAHWDWRAAGNFICGGAGAGLLVLSAIVSVQVRMWVVLGGAALVGAGLFCVWLEIGRPLRALHVMFHPQRSWMTRESFVALLLFPCALAVLLGVSALGELLALLALVFVFCQGRILSAAKGIPAWREPMTTPLVMVTGLAEGAGLIFATEPWHGFHARWMPLAITVLVMLRLVVWQVYRKRLAGKLAKPAERELDAVGRVLLIVGTVIPLLAVGLHATGVLPFGADLVSGLVGGLAATLAGSYLKYALITRAGYNQGFALVKLPVRGVPR